MIQPKITRFRAYQLGNEGSSFSYFDGRHFSLIEGRLTDVNEITLDAEMAICGVERIDVLHITSWDEDHCNHPELMQLLYKYLPKKIETPGYDPGTECGIDSKAAIIKYERAMASAQEKVNVISITPEYLGTLDNGKSFEYNNILFHPRVITDSSNNNSTIKLFRSGSFSVLSFGDVESPKISTAMAQYDLAKEVDVMILAHHGADNDFTTDYLLNSLSPTIAISTSNYDNQYGHPRQEIRDMLSDNDILLFTTKTGDCIVRSIGDHTGTYKVVNLKADSTEISSTNIFQSKRK